MTYISAMKEEKLGSQSTKKRIFVTGGAGYIGSHVVLALSDAGYDVLTFDNLSTGKRSAVLHGEFLQGDLADEVLLQKTLLEFRPDAVMHFAASIEVAESVVNPLKYYHNNSGNLLKLLKTLQLTGINRLIFSSTAAVYGQPMELPVTEEAPLLPINPYGASKMMSERMISDLSTAKKNFKAISLRYFNVAGADPDIRLGQNYANPTHLITRALKTALGQFPELQIFGTNYPTPDGTCVRDYIHVTDLANAHLAALEYLMDESRGTSAVLHPDHGSISEGASRMALNCGYGHGFSVQEVIAVAKQVTGIDFKVTETIPRAGDPPVLVADNKKIRELIGWTPQYDDLSFIIRTAWEWEKRLTSIASS